MKRYAKVLYDHIPETVEEISVRFNEKVEVLDSSKKWWKVRSRMGACGVVPYNKLELIGTSSRENQGMLLSTMTLTVVINDYCYFDMCVGSGSQVINAAGRNVPTPPSSAPPPPPSSAPPPPPTLAPLQTNGFPVEAWDREVMSHKLIIICVKILFFTFLDLC